MPEDTPQAGDIVDQVGHTTEDAKADHPSLDLSKEPASVRRPEGDEIVLAQTPEEVAAQIGAGSAEDED